MILRRLPRKLRASSLAMPLVMTLGCSTTRPEEPRSSTWRDDVGRCWYMESMSCPPDSTCNPPPPERIACPGDAKKIDQDHWKSQIGRIEDGSCIETVAPNCPPASETCDESPGRAVPCPDPKLFAFDRYQARPSTHVWRDEAGVCWSMPEMNCPPPEVGTCNPPPPQKVECPPELQKPPLPPG